MTRSDASRYESVVDISLKNSSQAQLVHLTGRNKKVLEVGPATGYVTKVLRARGCRVTGIEKDPAAANIASEFCDCMIVGDIEQLDFPLTFGEEQFDVVMFGDVLEHLVDPTGILERVRPLLPVGGYVVASIPNVAHASVRLMLLDGKFSYTREGLLDSTHLRFFTKTGVETLFVEAGYSIRTWRRIIIDALSDPSAGGVDVGVENPPAHLVDALRHDPETKTYQFVVRAYPRRARKPSKRKSQGISASGDRVGGVLNALWHVEEAISQHEQKIAHAEATLAEKDASLVAKDAALAEKDASLVAKDTALAEKESRIASADAMLTQTEEQLRLALHQIHVTKGAVGYRLLERARVVINWLAPPGSWRRGILKVFRKGMRIILAEGMIAFVRRAVPVWRWAPRLIRRAKSAPPLMPLDDQYQLWLRANALTLSERSRLKKWAAEFSYRPKVSILMPVYNTDPSWLRKAVDSVRGQLYDHWELCIADDCSGRSDTRKVLEQYQRQDSRIRVKYLSKNLGIAGASNEALSLATGDLVGLLDHDDVLKPDALFEVVKLLNERPEVDYIYSDEDKEDPDGRLVEPFFKPDWSPDLLLSMNYLCHFSVFRKEIMDRLEGFRQGYDGSQDYDLVLRATELTDHIAHIAKPLYTWRKVAGSAAASIEAKPFAYQAAKRAIKDALARRGADAEVQDGHFKGFYRVRYAIPGNPRVAIVIPTRDRVDMLRRCVESIRTKTSYRNYEVFVIDNESGQQDTLTYLSSFPGQVIHYPHEFNFARMMNEAARQIECDALLFLNNDTEVISHEWIEAMLEHGMRPEVAAIGARLVFPNGDIQHEGILVGPEDGLPCNLDHRGYFSLGEVIRNCSAVTAACMLTRPSVFRDLGGFDERFRIAYNDVDFCLRARRRGYLIIHTPYALLRHHEGGTRGRTGKTHPPEDRELFWKRWGSYRDPYYNPNLDLQRPFTIRVRK